jgi:hypothetical protein
MSGEKRSGNEIYVVDEDACEVRSVGFDPNPQPGVLSFEIEGLGEVLKVTPEGFFVRGRAVDVEDVDQHDREVYRAFREFLLEVERRPNQRLIEVVRGLLEIIDSDHVRHCEAVAGAHGYRLDERIGKRFGRIVTSARKALEDG